MENMVKNIFNYKPEENINILKEKFKKIKNMNWIKFENNNNYNGSAGTLLEKLLDVSSGNFEIPDYENIEIKTKYSTKYKDISLFTAVPDSYLFETKRLTQEYGYPDKDFKESNILNVLLIVNKFIKINTHYFLLKLNEEEKKLCLEVYDLKFNMIDNNTSWSFDLLKEKLLRKLSYLAIIDARKKIENKEIFYKFINMFFYKLKDFNTFIYLLKNGKITLKLRVGIHKDPYRKGQPYDHGSVFCIDRKDLKLLFNEIK